MKITKSQLKQIIKEELQAVLREADADYDGIADDKEQAIKRVLDGGPANGQSGADRDAVRMLLQYTYSVPAEQVGAMVDKLGELGGEDWRQAAEEGQITDEAEQVMGLEIKPRTPRSEDWAPEDPRTARRRVAQSGWRGDMVAPKEYDPQGRGWQKD